MSNTTGVISGTGTAYLSGTPEFTLGFWSVHTAQSLVFRVLVCGSFCRFSFFILGHSSVCRSSMNDYLLLLWYLEMFHPTVFVVKSKGIQYRYAHRLHYYLYFWCQWSTDNYYSKRELSDRLRLHNLTKFDICVLVITTSRSRRVYVLFNVFQQAYDW